jgi:hypothetical protein
MFMVIHRPGDRRHRNEVSTARCREHADKQNCQAFLEAAPDALPLYQKFGFQTAAEMHTLIKTDRVPEGEVYTVTFMIREPREN